MFSRLLFPFSVLAMLAVPCLAQSQDAASGSSSSAKSATPPANGQANTFTEKTKSSTKPKKPKKVWTNDEIGSVKGDISVVGNPPPSPGNSGNKEPATSAGAGDARQMQVKTYRHQIQDLQAQINAADKRIAQLKNFKGENSGSSGGINLNQGYDMVPIEDQVKQLEEKKKQLQAKIGDVEDEARKDGIDSGDLR